MLDSGTLFSLPDVRVLPQHPPSSLYGNSTFGCLCVTLAQGPC